MGATILLSTLVLVGATLSVQAPTAGAAGLRFRVNTTKDGADANPGDGTCATSKGRCTLRAAVMEANALAGRQTIALRAATYRLTRVERALPTGTSISPAR